MDADAIRAFLAREFPEAASFAAITRVQDGEVECVLPYDARNLRPGGTLSGPTLMTLADTAVYVLVLATLGPVALAVTTSLAIHFLERPRPGDLRAVARLLKLGKRLVVAEVHLYGSGADRLVAQATVTYARPPSAG